MNSEPDNHITRAIRKAFVKSGWSIRALSKASRVPYPSTHGVVTGKRDPQSSVAAKLAAALGLELRPTRKAGDSP